MCSILMVISYPVSLYTRPVERGLSIQQQNISVLQMAVHLKRDYQIELDEQHDGISFSD